jgi:hypothetical protein
MNEFFQAIIDTFKPDRITVITFDRSPANQKLADTHVATYSPSGSGNEDAKPVWETPSASRAAAKPGRKPKLVEPDAGNTAKVSSVPGKKLPERIADLMRKGATTTEQLRKLMPDVPAANVLAAMTYGLGERWSRVSKGVYRLIED